MTEHAWWTFEATRGWRPRYSRRAEHCDSLWLLTSTQAPRCWLCGSVAEVTDLRMCEE